MPTTADLVSSTTPGRRPMSVPALARVLSLASLVLVACAAPVAGGCGGSGDDLPDAFRVDAEIVSVEPGPGLAPESADNCTPTMDDVSEGPDWRLEFARVHDAEEPTFKEFAGSTNHDGANRCQDDGLGGGLEDCCRPLVAVDGGWRLECDGTPAFVVRNYFAFTFADDGSGIGVTTRRNDATGAVICIATTEWSALLPL